MGNYQVLTLPKSKIPTFINNEQTIYAYRTKETTRDSLMNITKALPMASKTHVVKSGESISTIARKYGVTVADLKKWNKLPSNKLKRGQRLKVTAPFKAKVEEVTSQSAVTSPESSTNEASEGNESGTTTSESKPANKATAKPATSSAGEDGSITACLHEPVDLLAGLDGNVDLSGTWYDPSNVAIANSQITTGGFGGNYNYDYIAGNGVCPNDTANVVVIVDASCDFLDITEETFAGIQVYPNPTNGVVFVAASNNAGNFSYEVTDANGRVIAEAINGVTAAATTSIDLSKVETGVYFIQLSNATAKKVYRIVVQ
jgi:LysM repeat protein